MSDIDFILDFQKQDTYPYLEEVNEGILRHVPPCQNSSTILDVGAGRGALAASFCKLGYKVYAIESNENIATEAKKRIQHVICADLQDIETICNRLEEQKFDYIVFSDILEHVFDPLQTLKQYQQFLKKDGKILISLPNAVNWLNRCRVLFGRFHYEMTGVMDRTHIRFFTFRSAKELVEASACRIERVDCTPFLIRAFLPWIKRLFKSNQKNNSANLMTSPYYQFYSKYIYPLEYWISRRIPTLFAFRIILVAKK